ncbi:TonB-dependent receptor domain-containing protein [Hoylesella oralis]|uniref:TonB-dependent receptor n=1 Tax=Hoylesella oralis TaxID=28134 RepID=UPI0028EF6312|nr:TonB-dependent receptor [Hoylesella oralis]
MLCTILLLASCVLDGGAGTADTAAIRTMGLDEVTVVEFKQNRRNLAPSSVSTADARFLNNQEITSLKELTAVMPNFFIPDYGSRQNTPVYIRGIGAKTKGPAVGFYVDGVPHFENSAFDIDMFDVESVAVLRGPQGTLYGRNAIGGIINVHTLSPLYHQGTRLKAGYGSRNDVVAQFSHYMKFSDRLGFSAAGGYHHNDGFFRNLFTGNKADDMNDGFGRLNFVWAPSAQWTLRLNSMLDYSEQGGYPYGAFSRTTGTTSPVNYNRYSSYRRLISTSGFNARYEGQSFGFNSQTSYQFIKDHQAIDQDFTPKDLYFVINELRQNMVSQEFTFKSNHTRRYQWIFGVFGMLQNVNNTLETQYIAKDQAFPTHYRIPVYAFALYHQSSYNIWRGLSITAGLRFDYEYAKHRYLRRSYQLSTNGNWMDVKSNESSLHFRQLTPKFGLQYLTEARNLYYISVTRGYKAGGFNQSFRTDDERTYSPEYNWNYEAGAKLNLLRGTLTAETALFYIDWRHQQVNQTVPGIGNVLHNAGHSSSKGFELSLMAHPLSGLELHLSYGYTYSKFIEYRKSATVDYSGNKLPMVPRNTLALNVAYTWRPARGIVDKWVLGTGLTGVGKIYWAEDNAVAQDFYTLLNAKISATSGIFTWEVWGKNLTDTKYNTYSFKASADYAQLGRPAHFGTSVVVNF